MERVLVHVDNASHDPKKGQERSNTGSHIITRALCIFKLQLSFLIILSARQRVASLVRTAWNTWQLDRNFCNIVLCEYFDSGMSAVTPVSTRNSLAVSMPDNTPANTLVNTSANSANTYSPIMRNPPGKPISKTQKVMIINRMKDLKKLSPGRKEPSNTSIAHIISDETGISSRSIFFIIKEYQTTKMVSSPDRRRVCRDTIAKRRVANSKMEKYRLPRWVMYTCPLYKSRGVGVTAFRRGATFFFDFSLWEVFFFIIYKLFHFVQWK